MNDELERISKKASWPKRGIGRTEENQERLKSG
jgi:hypothetical protein